MMIPYFEGLDKRRQDIDPKYTEVIFDSQTSQYGISSEMKGNAINRFEQYTDNNIGHALTITLDGRVLSSAIIQSAIPGSFEIPCVFMVEQARAIVSLFQAGPLPFELKQMG